jgi:hypothetical protein
MLAAGTWIVHAIGGGGFIGELRPLALSRVATISVGWQHAGGIEQPPGVGNLPFRPYFLRFPIQQAVMTLSGNRFGPVGELAISLPLAVACTVFCWICIEHRPLAWKPSRRHAL